MFEDYTTLGGAFSPLSVDSSLGALDSGFDATGLSSFYGSVTPTTSTVANSAPVNNNSSANATANVSGFQSVLGTLTSLFNTGVTAYNDVAQKVGLPLSNGTPTTPTTAQVVAATPVFGGLTTSQLQLIGGGVALIVVLFLIRRR